MIDPTFLSACLEADVPVDTAEIYRDIDGPMLGAYGLRMSNTHRSKRAKLVDLEGDGDA